MPYANWIGRTRFWTKDRVLEGLKKAAGEIEGRLPRGDDEYCRLKKGRLDWPTYGRICFYFCSLSRGWLAVGVPMERVGLDNIDWSEEEISYVLEWAGDQTLEEIGQELGRSRGSVKCALQQLGVRARDNQGYMSAAQLAQELGCSVSRVLHFLSEGDLPGRYDRKRNRWNIDMGVITPELKTRLKAPRQTHKNGPIDTGDYYRRHNVRRKILGNKVLYVQDPVGSGVGRAGTS